MEFRYVGFEQQQNVRSYQFDVTKNGQPARRIIVTADISLFQQNHVGIQEGPRLCVGKLAANLERNIGGPHELTAADLRSHVNACILAEAQRALMRKPVWRHRPPEE